MGFDQIHWLWTLAAGAASLLVGSVILTALWQRKRSAWLQAVAEAEHYKNQLAHVRQLSESQKYEADCKVASQDREIVRLNTLVEQKEEQLANHRLSLQELLQMKDKHIELQARFNEKEEQLKSREQLLDESKKTLLKEFELAANKLFEAKQQTFNQSSRQNLETVLSPFKQQLQTFHKQVEDVYHRENTQRNQLIGQIGELQKQTRKISEDANNLASALKGDNKVQGDWGEIILERLLEQSGLEKGREYHTQYHYRHEGKTYRPDMVIHLPDEKDIIVDSKVALVEYERFVNEQTQDLKEQYLKAHVDVVRTHIRTLALKSYEKLEGLRTLDFVFMFIPIEAAYVSAVQHTPSLFKEAHDKNIMLVSPSSLMVALRTVETMWRYEKQNANAEKIAASAGRLYDQFALVLTALEDVGGYIKKAEESHDLVLKRLSRGRGNVLKRIDELKKLGAKTSKPLPKVAQESLQSDTDEIELLSDDES